MNVSVASAERRDGTGRWIAYPVYKDPGVVGLGEVPEGWEVRRLKFTASVTEGLVDPRIDAEGDRPLLAPNHIESGTGRILALESASEQGAISGKYRVRPGQVIYSKIRPALNKVAIAEGEWLCSADMYPLAPRPDVRAKYLMYWLLSAPFVRLAVDESMRVAMPKVNRDTLGSMWAVLPPLPEQRAIAAFLDRETAKIDTLVLKKERLLELLDEQRTALISRAVTKGLDPDAPMKDSGVEWLGEVPEGWEVRRLASAANAIGNGWVGPTRDILVDDGVPYVQSLHIKDGRIRFLKPYFVNESWLRRNRRVRLRTGMVLIVQTGEIGQVAMVPEEFEGAGCHALIMVELIRSRADGAFVSYALRSDYGREGLRAIQTGALHPHLNCSKVRELPIPLPPLPEQHAIAAYLDRETARIDALKTKIQRAIDLLKEYRTALISAAVTGKIDVRSEVTDPAA